MATRMPLIKRHSQPSGIPASAPVHEFICLFTHDLKRKQKRWQDGRLKFHTFNKRIMVYGERGNFIGDMHWNEDFAFGEGEEFNLERGAVIVQVAECIGTKDQDLTDLLDKRARDVEQPHPSLLLVLRCYPYNNNDNNNNNSSSSSSSGGGGGGNNNTKHSNNRIPTSSNATWPMFSTPRVDRKEERRYLPHLPTRIA
ncbi:hypothetical protein COL922a_007736 [Colletotrichum nupharicola]|nr:hypothetical protein COL922a_007736 [Colletotrichum nupharicola]